MAPRDRDELLNAWLDGELSGAERAAAEEMLQRSAEARAQLERLRQQDAELRRTLAPPPADADALVQRIAAAVGREPRNTVPALRSRVPAWTLAAAAGFLAGVIVWSLTHPKADTLAPESPAAPRTVGSVLALQGSATADDPAGPRALEAGSLVRAGDVVRTGPDSRCGLRLEHGTRVIVHPESAVSLGGPGTIELAAGLVLAHVPEDAADPLEIVVAGSTLHVRGTVECEPADPDPAGRAADADVSVLAGECRIGSEVLAAGTACTIDRGSVIDARVVPVRYVDWARALPGMEPDGEIRPIVLAALERLGRTKDSAGLERRIRGFGDKAVPVLLEYLASADAVDHGNRTYAAALIADLADLTHARDLLGLLDDADGEVRVHAARALQRITGAYTPHGDDYWRGADRRAGLDHWRREIERLNNP